MANSLTKVRFTEDYLPAVSDFYCGDEPWEREVADWIRGGPGGVFDDMKRGAEVWLYGTDEEGLIGFGSLSASNWKWPDTSSRPIPINIIPMLGIRREFWGQPSGPGRKRYSAQIVEDLIAEARQHTERSPLLGLFVHPNNHRAIRAYEKVGFKRFFRTYTDQASGTIYHSMILRLAPS